jgi:hypothetical protein
VIAPWIAISGFESLSIYLLEYIEIISCIAATMRFHPRSRLISATLAFGVFAWPFTSALAQSTATPVQPSSPQNLSDLTLANFFTEGWSDDYAKRSDPNGAPDMALLRVQTNFLEREFRADFFSEQGVNSTKNETVNVLDGLIAYGLDRRLMLSVTSNFEWIGSRVNNDLDESNDAVAARIQLIDVPGSSYAFNVKVTSPAKTLGNDLTTATYALAGWQDLTKYGLSRVGLYYDVALDSFIGPHTPGAKTTDVAYDVSLAKTWTAPDAALQNFTTFGELFDTTDTSGSFSGRNVMTFTPGIRTGIGHHQVLMAGVDLPVTHPRPYNWALRVTYIINF